MCSYISMLGWQTRASSPAGLARRPTCTGASPEDGSVESSAHCLAKCGFPTGRAQSVFQWLPPVPAGRRSLFPPTATVWVSTVSWAPRGSSCDQDRQVDRRVTTLIPFADTLLSFSPGYMTLPEHVPVVVDGPSEASRLREVIKESFKFRRSHSWDAVLAVGECVFENLCVHNNVLVSVPGLLSPALLSPIPGLQPSLHLEVR